jgi:hypothetical protein
MNLFFSLGTNAYDKASTASVLVTEPLQLDCT